MSNRYVKTPSDALGFFASLAQDDGLFLDTDKGFLKADNTSAFAKLTDKAAQNAQTALVEAVDMLAKENVDAWEVCTWLAMREATLRHCRKKTHSLMTVEFIEALSNQGDSYTANQCRIPLDEETAQLRTERRATFVMDSLQTLQGMNEALAQREVEEVQGYNVFVIAADLFPPLVHRLAEWACAHLRGTSGGKHHSSLEDLTSEKVRQLAADAIMENDLDYDDETPTW